MIFTVVALFVLIGFASLAVDWGHLQLVKTQLVTATNAAARAALVDGASSNTTAVNAAISYASMNSVDGTPLAIVAGDVTRGTWDGVAKTFTANTTSPNAVRVVGVRSAARGSAVLLSFSSLFGVPQRDLTYTAIATASRDVQVNIAPYCNADIMTVDGTPVSGGGADNSGYAMSDTLIGGSVRRGDTTYSLLRTNADAIRCAGQTIPLPAGKFKSVILFAVQGYGPVTSTFTLNNWDGSRTAYAQSISDWCAPRSSVPNEDVCNSFPYRNASDGSRRTGNVYLLSYEFPIMSSSGVASVTLPSLNTLSIVAIGMTPAEAVTVR